jgi:hypothetical protein
MADESHSPPNSDHAVSAALLGAPTNDPPSDESSTKGMLRDVIHKVMEEIEHHEREAKKHTQKAGELRRDLRESFAFVQEAKKSDARPAKTEESKPAESSAKVKSKDAPADDKSHKASAKKKPAAKAK